MAKKEIIIKTQTDKFSLTMTNIISIFESNYLLDSRKDICRMIIKKRTLEEGDILDFLLSLHIVLEVGINGFFRTFISPTFKKDIDLRDMIENLDKISFIDKVVIFIYYSKFKFDDIEKATNYHKIIGELKSFSEIRNKILHGHAVSTISTANGEDSESILRKKLNHNILNSQIRKFKFILEGLKYYIMMLDSSLVPNGTGRESYINRYLDGNFLS